MVDSMELYEKKNQSTSNLLADDNCAGYNKCKFHHKQCTVFKKYGHACAKGQVVKGIRDHLEK